MSAFPVLTDPKPDKVFGLVAEYKADERANKINLAIGAYSDAKGRTICFDAVATAMRELVKDPECGYLPPAGDPVFRDLSQKLVFQTNEVNECISSVQSPSGTGALTLAGNLTKMLKPEAVVYISNPTWPIHRTLFGDQIGHEVREYTYWDPKTKNIAFEAMQSDLNSANNGSIIIAHACAHNPTGQDLSKDHWTWLCELCDERDHLLIIDCAYQGFASGDFVKDGASISQCLDILKNTSKKAKPYKFIVCQSYAKNMSLYGHRIGCCHVVCDSRETQIKVTGHLGGIARRIWSNPPRFGSDVCKMILSNDNLREQWLKQLRHVSSELTKIRSIMRETLEKKIPNTSWKHLTDQIGMFAYTGLTAEQCHKLRKDHAIYLMDSGRISLAGIQPEDIEPICESIAKVY